MGLVDLVTGRRGPSGFGSSSTAEDVTKGIDASNLTVLITGGASGIGAEASRVLAMRGARVVIAARNLTAASEVKNAILAEYPKARIECLKIDLSSLSSVRSFAAEFLATKLPLNILINNAGIMMIPYELSPDGIEMQFATNHLGHFLLTNLLLDKMKETAKESGIQGRIVNLSSIAHIASYSGGIQFSHLNDKAWYSDTRAYSQSKLANILHAKELAMRFKAQGVDITANAVHPGFIMTPLMRHTFYIMRVLKFFSSFLWKNVPQGAATTCYAALHPSLKDVTGQYFVDSNKSNCSAYGRDPELAHKLWTFSQELIDKHSPS
ncbi:hypothetical protein SELMODRAFT_420551 [Selaginella moellendorffii]|uniref:Uncharacterized protein n=2 Tax=Selaginella moellendorffii TaxID=88036 RepID=D8SCC9_SELML|nr:hypothetical protein SELMODRAFT_420551 [Selaginella moellendorffii]